MHERARAPGSTREPRGQHQGQSARADLRSRSPLQLRRKTTSLAVSRALPLRACAYTSTHTCPAQTNRTVGVISQERAQFPAGGTFPLPEAPLQVRDFSGVGEGLQETGSPPDTWSKPGSALGGPGDSELGGNLEKTRIACRLRLQPRRFYWHRAPGSRLRPHLCGVRVCSRTWSCLRTPGRRPILPQRSPLSLALTSSYGADSSLLYSVSPFTLYPFPRVFGGRGDGKSGQTINPVGDQCVLVTWAFTSGSRKPLTDGPVEQTGGLG
ncbi:hypothetical protein NN561_015824 [Cricetulus griseus]